MVGLFFPCYRTAYPSSHFHHIHSWLSTLDSWLYIQHPTSNIQHPTSNIHRHHLPHQRVFGYLLCMPHGAGTTHGVCFWFCASLHLYIYMPARAFIWWGGHQYLLFRHDDLWRLSMASPNVTHHAACHHSSVVLANMVPAYNSNSSLLCCYWIWSGAFYGWSYALYGFVHYCRGHRGTSANDLGLSRPMVLVVRGWYRLCGDVDLCGQLLYGSAVCFLVLQLPLWLYPLDPTQHLTSNI